jgi:hypothetical protein
MSPDASPDPTIDLTLDAGQLQAEYDALAQDGQWGEHPKHPMAEWRTEVQCKKTIVGYWDWVVAMLRLADDKNDKDSILADAEEEEIEELQADDPGNQGS